MCSASFEFNSASRFSISSSPSPWLIAHVFSGFASNFKRRKIPFRFSEHISPSRQNRKVKNLTWQQRLQKNSQVFYAFYKSITYSARKGWRYEFLARHDASRQIELHFSYRNFFRTPGEVSSHRMTYLNSTYPTTHSFSIVEIINTRTTSTGLSWDSYVWQNKPFLLFRV